MHHFQDTRIFYNDLPENDFQLYLPNDASGDFQMCDIPHLILVVHPYKWHSPKGVNLFLGGDFQKKSIPC